MCVTESSQGQEKHRRRSERRDKSSDKFLRPVGKRTVAEVVHVAATRLVCQLRDYKWVGCDEAVHSQATEGLGGGCGGIFFAKSASQHSIVCHRKAMAETQLPEHSGGSGLDHENGLSGEVPRLYELRLSIGVVERYRRFSTCCGG